MSRPLMIAMALLALSSTACKPGPDPKLVPTLLAPADGAVADNGCTTEENAIVWDFDWTDVPGAQTYELWVKHRDSAEPDIHQTGLQTSSHRAGRIATIDGKLLQGWEWKVRAVVGGVEEPWTPISKFAVEPPDTDCQ